MTLRTANRRRLRKRYGPNSGRRALRLFSAACWTTTNMHESVGHYREVDDAGPRHTVVVHPAK